MVPVTEGGYALGSDRSAASIKAFLDHFLPRRRLWTDELHVPELSRSPTSTLHGEAEALDYMERHANQVYGLYWDDLHPTHEQAMAFYTSDGHVICGVACNPSVLPRRLQELASFLGTTHVLEGAEQRPPTTAEEFIALCERGGAARLT